MFKAGLFGALGISILVAACTDVGNPQIYEFFAKYESDGLIEVLSFCEGMDTPRSVRILVNQLSNDPEVDLLESADFLLLPDRGDLGPFPPTFANYIVETMRNPAGSDAIAVTFPNGTVFPCSHMITRVDGGAISPMAGNGGMRPDVNADDMLAIEDWLKAMSRQCQPDARPDPEIAALCESRPRQPGISIEMFPAVRSDIVAIRSIAAIVLDLPEGRRTVLLYGPNARIAGQPATEQ